ncbi:MAG: hypothetical protein CL677_02475 [Bdellovibrionaceae bacterium]|nr:hypothetical protein [Pseudobdellovibrionaceae bacterium]
MVVRNLDTSRTKNLTLMNQSLSTSSGEHNYFSADRKWHHVIDPIKLQPASRPTVSVVGPKASTCDLLSTAFLSMPEVMARKVLRDEYEGYFIVNME